MAFWGHVGGFLTGTTLTWLLLLVTPQLRKRGDQPLVVRFVRGSVHDAAGKPVSDARFEIHADFHRSLTVTTDAKGRFTVPSVPNGGGAQKETLPVSIRYDPAGGYYCSKRPHALA